MRSCRGAFIAPSCFGPEVPVQGTSWPCHRIAASPRPCPGRRLSASPRAPRAPRAAGLRLRGRPSSGWVLIGTAIRAVIVCVWIVLSVLAARGGRCCLVPGPVPWLWPASYLPGVPHGPVLVRPALSGPVALDAHVACPVALVASPTGDFAPPESLGGCAGHVEAGQEPVSWCLPLSPAEAGAMGSLRVVSVRGPVMGLSLAGPSGLGLALLALQWFGVCGPGHSHVRFPVPSVFRRESQPVHPGFFVSARTPPFSGRRTPSPGPVRVCVCSLFLPGSGRLASWARFGAPHFSCGRSRCLLCFLGLSGRGLPVFCVAAWPLWFFPALAPCSLAHLSLPLLGSRVPFLMVFSFVRFLFPCLAPLCSLFCAAPPPHAIFCLAVLFASLLESFFFAFHFWVLGFLFFCFFGRVFLLFGGGGFLAFFHPPCVCRARCCVSSLVAVVSCLRLSQCAGLCCLRPAWCRAVALPLGLLRLLAMRALLCCSLVPPCPPP